MSGVHSVHFAPLVHPPEKPKRGKRLLTEPNAQTVPEQVQITPKPNVITALDNAGVNAGTILHLMKGIIGSDNRHGDLCAIRSAAKNLITNLDVLIQAEEES
jgi:hypothetical protein